MPTRLDVCAGEGNESAKIKIKTALFQKFFMREEKQKNSARRAFNFSDIGKNIQGEMIVMNASLRPINFRVAAFVCGNFGEKVWPTT